MSFNPFAIEEDAPSSAPTSSNPFGAPAPVKTASSQSSRRSSSSSTGNPFASFPEPTPQPSSKQASKQESQQKIKKKKKKQVEEPEPMLTSVPELRHIVTADKIANVNPDEPSSLKATDRIRVIGADLNDDDDDSDSEQPSDDPSRQRRVTVSSRARPRASKVEVDKKQAGLLGVEGSTLTRTFSLSNKSQLELMKMVKEKRVSVNSALAWAEQREEEEAVPELSNQEQLDLLLKVKEGKLTQAQALEHKKKLLEKQQAQKVRIEWEETRGQTEDILAQVASFTLAPPSQDFDTASVDSFEAAIEMGGQLLSHPELLDQQDEPVQTSSSTTTTSSDIKLL